MLRAMFLLLLLPSAAYAQKGWEKEWNGNACGGEKGGAR